MVDIAMRYVMLVFGLSLMSLGIAFSVRSDLGTTPISSLPYVLSELLPLSLGVLLILMNLAFVALQILIRRRRFKPVQLPQIPVVVVFGVLNDVALWLLRDVSHSAYWQQWILVVIGDVLVSFGVALPVKAQTHSVWERGGVRRPVLE